MDSARHLCPTALVAAIVLAAAGCTGTRNVSDRDIESIDLDADPRSHYFGRSEDYSRLSVGWGWSALFPSAPPIFVADLDLWTEKLTGPAEAMLNYCQGHCPPRLDLTREALVDREEDWQRERLADLIRRATVAPKRRIATKPTAGSQRRRLAGKTQRGQVKALRGRVDQGEE